MLRLLTILLTFVSVAAFSQRTAETYCNPLNIDYTYMIYNSQNDLSYRSGADPAVVEFRGEYYLFVTRSLGYWHSTDLLNWDFIQPEKWYFQGCNAPAAHNYKDSVLYMTGDPSGSMSVLYTDNPKKGDWKIVPAILNNLQDPDLFIDDDDQAYIFWGSSNTFPIRGRKLDKNKRFIAEKNTTELFSLNQKIHGWERFGENHSDTLLKGYMEGAWLTKHNETYYMMYAAPGTEFNVYADGVYTAKSPMGPYTYQAHNPVVYKPGGFMNGAGHGSIVKTTLGAYWHFGSMALSVTDIWERRLCMHPIFFDKDGLMYSNTRFGDYPHYAPNSKEKTGEFRGWMLLSYNKPIKSSSPQGIENLTDENVKTFWLSKTNTGGEWFTIDLEKTMDIRAIQINFHDHKSDMYGRYENLKHRYLIEYSTDGSNWKSLIDKSNSFKDTPNDYVELDQAYKARFLKYTNIEVPTPSLAISDIRIFGNASGKAPSTVKNFKVERLKDRRDAKISWKQMEDCQGYNIIWGIAPDKLYNSWMIYGKNEHLLKSLDSDKTYYITIEAFNENGISKTSQVIEVK
ncbi:family 43 glycosylhydrolase [Labilibaculum manganireducens]|uniref:family 43 glycosylhydrolase n=1 Tax=Labilibaculum manganireducens TaxID=1940525 RepID=UPI0029F4BC60|nr:family 43 glycosylhydrolase [Labilibaculum manganireducens]